MICHPKYFGDGRSCLFIQTSFQTWKFQTESLYFTYVVFFTHLVLSSSTSRVLFLQYLSTALPVISQLHKKLPNLLKLVSCALLKFVTGLQGTPSALMTVVTTPANTQHCPNLTGCCANAYSLRMSADPVHSVGDFPPLQSPLGVKTT